MVSRTDNVTYANILFLQNPRFVPKSTLSRTGNVMCDINFFLQHPKICMSGAKDPSRIPESPRWQNRVWGGWGRERPAVVKTVKLKKELDMMQEEKR